MKSPDSHLALNVCFSPSHSDLLATQTNPSEAAELVLLTTLGRWEQWVGDLEQTLL